MLGQKLAGEAQERELQLPFALLKKNDLDAIWIVNGSHRSRFPVALENLPQPHTSEDLCVYYQSSVVLPFPAPS